jgi:hypothetical protein
MKTLKAYKVFDENWKCRGFQYEVGRTYEIKEKPILCERGFHACVQVQNCFSYYGFDPKNKVAEVLLSGIIIGQEGEKQCAQKIKILKELSWESMLIIANIGKGNSGHSNSGNSNSGHWNSGDSNSGDRNSGNRNSGNWNSGHWNSGHSNSGDRNSGHRNSGHWNSGNSNSGNSNSGNWNSGNRNSGNWNSGNWNSGMFNSITPDTILIFNKPCKRNIWESALKPDFIFNIATTQWISWSSMTDDEKKENKDAFVTDGYLKRIDYKEAWKTAYENATKEDIQLLKALPNFNKKVFEEISGIKIK